MKHFRPFLFGFLLIFLFTSSLKSQNPPPALKPPPSLPSVLKSGAPVPGVPGMGTGGGEAARQYMSQGQAYLANGRVQEAKEAFRTAIRLEPMNLEAWAQYDYAVETHYIGRSREEKLNPVIERDLKPTFAVTRVESYMEFEDLYLVGEMKNVSDTIKRRIEITGMLLDANKQEIRRESTFVTLSDRGLFPGESSLFEVRFKNPPPGIKSYRVRVSNYE